MWSRRLLVTCRFAGPTTHRNMAMNIVCPDDSLIYIYRLVPPTTPRYMQFRGPGDSSLYVGPRLDQSSLYVRCRPRRLLVLCRFANPTTPCFIQALGHGDSSLYVGSLARPLLVICRFAAPTTPRCIQALGSDHFSIYVTSRLR